MVLVSRFEGARRRLEDPPAARRDVDARGGPRPPSKYARRSCASPTRLASESAVSVYATYVRFFVATSLPVLGRAASASSVKYCVMPSTILPTPRRWTCPENRSDSAWRHSWMMTSSGMPPSALRTNTWPFSSKP